MGKTKQKNGSELEYFRGIVKELQSENRSLKKELRRYEKYQSRSQDEEIKNDSDDTMTDTEFKLKKDCDSCGKGKVIETLQILDKHYGTCNLCGYHERLK